MTIGLIQRLHHQQSNKINCKARHKTNVQTVCTFFVLCFVLPFVTLVPRANFLANQNTVKHSLIIQQLACYQTTYKEINDKVIMLLERCLFYIMRVQKDNLKIKKLLVNDYFLCIGKIASIIKISSNQIYLEYL